MPQLTYHKASTAAQLTRRKKGFENRQVAPTAQYDIKLARSSFAKKRESTGCRTRHNYNLEKLQTNRK